MNRFTTRSLLLAADLAFSVAGLAAAAPAMAETPQVAVHYGDLDLSSAKGQKTLVRRVNDAASDLCQGFDNPGHIEFQRCRAEVLGRTRQQIAQAEQAQSTQVAAR